MTRRHEGMGGPYGSMWFSTKAAVNRYVDKNCPLGHRAIIRKLKQTEAAKRRRGVARKVRYSVTFRPKKRRK